MKKNKYRFILSNDYDDIIYEIIQYMEKHIVYSKYLQKRNEKLSNIII